MDNILYFILVLLFIMHAFLIYIFFTNSSYDNPNKYICTERQYAKVMKRTADCYEDTDLNHVQCYSSAIIALCSEK